MQKKLEVNIDNYKLICKRYKIGERNVKGKEYLKSTDKLIFVGEYLIGKEMELVLIRIMKKYMK